MAAFQFRLQPLLDRELERRQEAQDAALERQKELRAELEAAETLRRRQTELAEDRTARRRALLISRLGKTVSGGEVESRAGYLATLARDLEAARDAVVAQDVAVHKAEEKVAAARGHLAECTRRVDVLQKYRDRLQDRWRRAAERKEAIEQDEMGNVLYLTRSRRA